MKGPKERAKRNPSGKKVAAPTQQVKKRGPNFPAELKRRVIEDWKEDNSDRSYTSFARKYGIKKDTIRRWILTQDRENEESANENQATGAILEWIRRQFAHGTVTVNQVHQHLSHVGQRWFNAKTYGAQRMLATRLLDRAHHDTFGFMKRSNLYHTEAPTGQLKRVRCRCKMKCGYSCLNRKKQHECTPQTCGAQAKNGPSEEYDCSNRPIQLQQTAELYRIVCSDEVGYGMAAKEPIKERAFIIEYQGEVISREEYKRRKDRHHSSYAMQVNKNAYIDSERYGNEARFINHACKPNAAATLWIVNGIKRVGIFARHAIEANEEVTISYGAAYELWGDCQCKECKECK